MNNTAYYHLSSRYPGHRLLSSEAGGVLNETNIVEVKRTPKWIQDLRPVAAVHVPRPLSRYWPSDTVVVIEVQGCCSKAQP